MQKTVLLGTARILRKVLESKTAGCGSTVFSSIVLLCVSSIIIIIVMIIIVNLRKAIDHSDHCMVNVGSQRPKIGSN